MVTKKFLVLANSIKHAPARCIAGAEIEPVSGQPMAGHWVRPVSPHGEGELNIQQTTLAGGGQPQVFDIVEVQCESACNEPSQPENWLIQSGSPWVKAGTLGRQILPTVVETPASLWNQPGTKVDRVTREYMAAHPPQQSLYLINIAGGELSGAGYRFRLDFVYSGTRYYLSVTDPSAGAILAGASTVQLGNCHICVSLAPAFLNSYDGRYYHYKLVAALIL